MGENLAIDFNAYDYGIGHDYLTFERYVRFPSCFFDGPSANKVNPFNSDYSQAVDFPQVNANEAEMLLQKKDAFCGFIVSNDTVSDMNRITLFHLLNEYKQVLSGGRVLNNVGGPVKNKLELISRCKFSIACENSSTPGYVTEKIKDALCCNTIPIYWGDPKIIEEINPACFINCHDYSSLEEVVARVKEIDANDDLWKKMIMTPNKINIEKSSKALRDLERFLVYICSQPPKKRIHEYRQEEQSCFDVSAEYYSMIQEQYQIPVRRFEQLAKILYKNRISEKAYEEQKKQHKTQSSKRIEVSIHGGQQDNYYRSHIYKVLQSMYHIVEREEAKIHLYFDEEEAIASYEISQERVNIYIVTSEEYNESQAPDFNIYDYAIGYHEIEFGQRYLNLQKNNQEEDIREFFTHIFESTQPSQRRQKVLIKYSPNRYIDTGSTSFISSNAIKIRKVVQQYKIKKHSLFYIILHGMIFILKMKNILRSVLRMKG